MDSRQSNLEAILQAREARVQHQRALIEKYKYPLVSFTLNIPGPEKNNPIFYRVHDLGIKHLEDALKASNMEIFHRSIMERAAGREGFFSIRGEVDDIKKLTVELEEKHELGRLFDFDVIDQHGNPISRSDLGLKGRGCLLCEDGAALCKRRGNHTLEELLKVVYDIIKNYDEL